MGEGRPGQRIVRWDENENDVVCDKLASHYAQYGLKDPVGYFDSEDEEVQHIQDAGFRRIKGR